MTRQEIEERLIVKAWQDGAFKNQLLSNPVEETPNAFYIVIPVQPSGTEELSEAELEAIAGGSWIDFGCMGGLEVSA